MQVTEVSTLIRALKELDLATERINRERRRIVTDFENHQREPATSHSPTKTRRGRKARRTAGTNRGDEPRGKPIRGGQETREFLRGDRLFITNQVKSTSGHKAPRESDRYATVRYQQVLSGGKVQVFLVTDSGVRTYRLSTNVIHIGANYSCYEAGRSCYVARTLGVNPARVADKVLKANQLA